VRILLAKLNHIGDTLLMTPTVRLLREQYPDSQIDVLVRSGCEEILKGNPDINHVIPIARPDKAKRNITSTLLELANAFPKLFLRRYDYAFDLSDSDRSKIWILLSASKVRGINDAYQTLGGKKRMFNRISDYKWGMKHQVLKDFCTVLDCTELNGEAGPLQFHPQASEATIARKVPFISGIGDFVVLHPTSRWAFKQWMPERWAEIADIIRQDYKLAVVFSCGPEQREIDLVSEIRHHAKEEHFSTDGSITLHEFGWLLGRARLFLGVDTVAMHLAAAMQTPIVALFGPSSEWSWRPWHCDHELVLGDCECKRTRKFICDKTKPYPCMQSIQVNDVKKKVHCMLQQL
jgi:heptosyltransferase III